ncbi:HAD family hydrolase [Legionella oakridgensis]|uniref:HAD family hydrolase n=1 Tax=Legionella oakridgensis TaxID=29423 RepID=UPI0003DDFD2B|nr:HAD family phosphatase [Legionella oakridgensis]ETO93407.1 haloacid dehalogenase superfamily, subfamily IA [Legionella oakridgensis RV-2-2007]
MFAAVIFDFDGVILDSEPMHYEASRLTLQEIGIHLEYQEYSNEYLGLSDKEMFPQILMNKKLFYSSNEISALVDKKIKHYIHIINNCDRLPITPNVDQCIRSIARANKKIAICTGSTKREIFPVLEKINYGHLYSYFDTIVTSEDVQYGKPSPEGYLLTAKRLNVPTHQCLVIEDSPHGVEAAKKAGMYVMALLTSYERQEELQAADKIIHNLEELLCVTTNEQVLF